MNIVLLHNCGEQVYLYASMPSVFITTSLTLSAKGSIDVGTGQIIASSLKPKITDTFYCPSCRKKVGVDTLISYCSICRETSKLENLVIAIPKLEKGGTPAIVHEGDCLERLRKVHNDLFGHDVEYEIKQLTLNLGGVK